MEHEKKHLLVIDSNSIIHRAYHALPRLTTKNGELINAVYGFLLVFFRAIKDLKPDYIVACFDLPVPTFRHKQFKEYKATRQKTPDDLSTQIPKVKEALQSFSIPIFEKQGFEADDLLAAISNKVKNDDEKIETIIISGDLDTLQLVDDNTRVCFLKKGVKNMIFYDKNKVLERYGLSPTQLPDYKALAGDASDNIPGVPGIGPKTATALLKEFGSLESIYENVRRTSHQFCERKKNGDAFYFGKTYSAPGVAGSKDGKIGTGQVGRIGSILKEYKEQAFLSKDLARLRADVPLELDLKKCELRYDKEKVVDTLKEFEFESLISRLPEKDSGKEKNNTRTLF